MVDGEVEEEQDRRDLSLQLRGSLARQLSTCQQVNKPLDVEQYAEPNIQHNAEDQVEALSETLRGLCEGASLHHGEDTRGY